MIVALIISIALNLILFLFICFSSYNLEKTVQDVRTEYKYEINNKFDEILDILENKKTGN